MSSDTDRHHALLAALNESPGKGNGSFERAVIDAFEHVFDHLGRLNSHVTQGRYSGEERLLEDSKSATLR